MALGDRSAAPNWFLRCKNICRRAAKAPLERGNKQFRHRRWYAPCAGDSPTTAEYLLGPALQDEQLPHRQRLVDTVQDVSQGLPALCSHCF